MSLNKVLLIGNVGADPEVRHLEGGSVVANLRIATNERYKDRNGNAQEVTQWHSIVCWRNLADLCEKYIKKGSQIFVEGRIRTNKYTDKTGIERERVEILADNIRLLDRKGSGVPSENNSYTENNNYTPVNAEESDDLPF